MAPQALVASNYEFLFVLNSCHASTVISIVVVDLLYCY
jgi:hypothetical protein